MHELDLNRLIGAECASGKPVRDVFPLSAFFARADGPTGAIMLAETLARSLRPRWPVRFDLEEKRWRHYDAELGVWVLSDGVRRELEPRAGPQRFLRPAARSRRLHPGAGASSRCRVRVVFGLE